MVLPCASGALARGWMGRPLSNLRTQVLITLHSFNKDTHPRTWVLGVQRGTRDSPALQEPQAPGQTHPETGSPTHSRG